MIFLNWLITGGIDSPLAMAIGSFLALLLVIWYARKTKDLADEFDRFMRGDR